MNKLKVIYLKDKFYDITHQTFSIRGENDILEKDKYLQFITSSGVIYAINHDIIAMVEIYEEKSDD